MRSEESNGIVYPDSQLRRQMNQRSFEFPTFASLCFILGVRSYVEVGVGRGASASYMAILGVQKIVGIDKLEGRAEFLKPEHLYISAESSSQEAVSLALQYLGGNPDAVFIDAEHWYDDVRKDFETWWPLTNKILGFHDICLSGTGVPQLWKELSPNYRSLEIVAKDNFSNSENPLDTHPNGEWAGIGVLLKA